MFQERQTTHFFGVTNANQITFGKDKESNVWLTYTNPKGNKSSINLGIDPKAIGCPMTEHKKRALKIEFKPNASNLSYEPIVGQQYTLNIAVPQYNSYSECPLNLVASAMATDNSKYGLIAKLAMSLVEQNYAITKHTKQSIIKVYLGSNLSNPLTFEGGEWKIGSYTQADAAAVIATVKTNSYTSFIVVEDFQDWQWGVFEHKFVTLEKDKVRFDRADYKQTDSSTSPSTETTISNSIDWGDVDSFNTNETIKMTRTLADMEYQHVMNRFDGNFAGRREFMHLMSAQCVINGLIDNSSENPSGDTSCNVIRVRCKYRGEDGHDVQENFYEVIIAGAAAIPVEGEDPTPAVVGLDSSDNTTIAYKFVTEAGSSNYEYISTADVV